MLTSAAFRPILGLAKFQLMDPVSPLSAMLLGGGRGVGRVYDGRGAEKGECVLSLQCTVSLTRCSLQKGSSENHSDAAVRGEREGAMQRDAWRQRGRAQDRCMATRCKEQKSRCKRHALAGGCCTLQLRAMQRRLRSAELRKAASARGLTRSPAWAAQ